MINNSGQIIGDCSSAGSNDHAVLWQNGTVTTLATLGGLQVTEVTGINNNGQLTGWGTTSTGVTHRFLDSNGTVTDLGGAVAINDNGQIAVTTTTTTETNPTTTTRGRALLLTPN